MRCPTCGEHLAFADERCSVCGSAVTDAPEVLPAVRRCPRCRYAGEGIGYFRRPGHLVLLAAVSLFTWGLGGIVYWLVRRNQAVCPSCGLAWGYALEAVPTPGELRRGEPPVGLPSAGATRRVIGALLALVATVVFTIGVFGLEPVLIAVGGSMGLGGTASFLWGWRALRERRRALHHVLERNVLQLATRRGGALTVTDVAASLDVSLAAAERLLVGMDDGFRVRSDVTDEGVLLFEFPEVQHRSRRS